MRTNTRYHTLALYGCVSTLVSRSLCPVHFGRHLNTCWVFFLVVSRYRQFRCGVQTAITTQGLVLEHYYMTLRSSIDRALFRVPKLSRYVR